ncbi:MAG: DEAD/DEAH box helicase, partial [Lysobacteraceae bacterium]
MSFDTLGLSPALLRALSEAGYATPTPIQTDAIPLALSGHDLLAGAQTGTGKTAAFGLPLLQTLAADATVQRRPRALILTPTRELAAQVAASLRDYGKHLSLRIATVFGGVGMQPQVDALRRGVDILVATPGRLIDHLDRGSVDLSQVRILVLDEADRMLDMGFLPAINRILKRLPTQRQTLLFSATFAPEIKALAQQFMRNPREVQVTPSNSTAPRVRHLLHPVDSEQKRDLLLHVLAADSRRQTLVFCRTKHGSDKVQRILERAGLRAAAIHGNKSQNARTRALADFKSGKITVLVATDIAARGIDIDQLPAVINLDLPNVPEDYVHRIGRTGRAGAEGLAISLVSSEESEQLRAIERLLDSAIEKVEVEGFIPTRPLKMTPPGRQAQPGKPRPAGAANNRHRRP